MPAKNQPTLVPCEDLQGEQITSRKMEMQEHTNHISPPLDHLNARLEAKLHRLLKEDYWTL